jgi:hypothetical protein
MRQRWTDPAAIEAAIARISAAFRLRYSNADRATENSVQARRTERPRPPAIGVTHRTRTLDLSPVLMQRA